jgi:hypothetical protein
MADAKRGASAVERLLGKTAPRHEPEVEQANDGIRDAFDADDTLPTARGRSAVMLDCRKANGQRHAMSYAYLTQIDFEPGDRLKLHFAGQVVQIGGRRLRPLYQRLLEHRVHAIQEGTDAEEGLKPDDAPHIERLEIIKQKEADHDDN